MRLIVTRPEEDGAPLKARLEALGHAVRLCPLIAITPREDVDIPDLDFQALLVTSANGIRSLNAAAHLKSIRLIAVGPQSLAAARAAGFTNAERQGGDVTGLIAFAAANLDPGKGPLLYLSGAETTGDLQARLAERGFEVERVTLYDARPADRLGLTAGDLEAADAVLLYSPRSARIWAALAEAGGVSEAAGRLCYLCLSPNVAAALPAAWQKTIANSPNDAEMMALLEQTARTR